MITDARIRELCGRVVLAENDAGFQAAVVELADMLVVWISIRGKNGDGGMPPMKMA